MPRRNTFARSRALLLALTLALAVAALAGLPRAQTTATAATQPDVIIILTDDQRAGTEQGMPFTWDYFSTLGTYYPNAQVPTNLCCPSRAALLTGRYAHETNVWTNFNNDRGGYEAYRPHENNALPKALQEQGYETSMYGKLLNGFSGYKTDATGWDNLHQFVKADYWGSVNGLPGTGYTTDTLRNGVTQQLANADPDTPQFIWFSPYGPHEPFDAGPYRATTATRDRMLQAGGYRNPSFNQRDMSGKPRWLQSTHRLGQRRLATIDRQVRQQADTLMGIDEAVRQIVETQQTYRDLSNTVIVYMSDNGYAWGDQRLLGKRYPHRSINAVPLMIKYPDHMYRVGTDNRLINNVDVAETIAAITGANVQTSGVNALGDQKRLELLLEATPYDGGQGAPHPGYCGVRTTRMQYVYYGDRTEELYDNLRDPWQVENLADRPAYTDTKMRLRAAAIAACEGTYPAIRKFKFKRR